MSEDNYDMSNMADAIDEIKPGRDTHYEGRSRDPDEASKKARDHGYGARVDYDYTQEATLSVATSKRYEFTGEFGVLAPRMLELEEQLFNEEWTYGRGERMDILEAVPIEVTGDDPVAPVAVGMSVCISHTSFHHEPGNPVSASSYPDFD